jgi:hypothetical protein
MYSLTENEGNFFRVWTHTKPYALEIERLADGARAHFMGNEALELALNLQAASEAKRRGEIHEDVESCDCVCEMYYDMLQVTH